MSYLESTYDLYAGAASTPDVGLCCTTTPIWQLPELEIPAIMLEMNYGCGSTVHPRDLSGNPSVLYLGVGGGMELLQFAYFSRSKGRIIGVDAVEDMLKVCRENLDKAAGVNEWFSKDFVDLRKGNALELPIKDASVDIVAQNCLFNIFKQSDLDKALSEAYRVLKPRGKLVLSDPICDQKMPEALRDDDHLRALCLSGAIPFGEYIDRLTEAGFATIEVRARRPYRVLSSGKYGIQENIFIESIEVAAIKDPMPADGPCVFTGKTAIYFGSEEYIDDGKGHLMLNNMPLAVCDKTAAQLESSGIPDLLITPSTYFYDGGGCC